MTTPNLDDLAARFAHAWQTPDAAAFAKLFSPNGSLTDHGAQIHVPHAYLEAHHRNWNGAHTSFVVTLDPYFPIYYSLPSPTPTPSSTSTSTSAPNPNPTSPTQLTKISFRTINKGIFSHDLPRRKATGKYFEYSGVIDLVVDEEGLVVKADEWLRVPFEDSVGVGEYIVIGPATQKGVQAVRD